MAGAVGVRIALQPLQVRSHIGRVLVAKVTVLLQRFVYDFFQLLRQIRVEPHRGDRCFVKNRIEHCGGGFPSKGEPTGGHFVDDSAERKEIGAGIEFLAQGLLGRHVGNRTEGCARTG